MGGIRPELHPLRTKSNCSPARRATSDDFVPRSFMLKRYKKNLVAGPFVRAFRWNSPRRPSRHGIEIVRNSACIWKFLLLACLLAFMARPVSAIEARAGEYRLQVVTDPPVVPVGKANLVVKVSDAEGKPVADLDVRAIARMPAMPMGEREQSARPGPRPGEYIVPTSFPMAGGYVVEISADGSKAEVAMKTGQNTGGEASIPWTGIAIGVVALALAAFVIARMRKTGQRLDTKVLWNRQVIGGILLLGIAIAIAVWAVRTQRRPGAMDPIEAQIMEMNTPAPEGSFAVELQKVQLRSFGPSIDYPGQVVGFNEQNLVSRVTGTILWMPLYVGDPVKKGQLLARLDTTLVDPELARRSAARGGAEQGVNVARMESSRASNAIREAEAEVSSAEAMTDEAKAQVSAKEQQRIEAQAEIEAALAEVSAREAQLESVQAEQIYARAELGRMKNLVDDGAISRDEYQRSEANARQADAAVAGARQSVAQAQASAAKARAAKQRVEAEILAAQRRVQQSEAGLRAKQAALRTAQSSLGAAEARIAQQKAGVREAAAGVRGALTEKGYSELRAEIDGIVTERLLSPGQIVSPGQSIMRLAQLRPVRVQANVSQSDLSKVQVGDPVEITVGNGKPVSSRVASVSPAVESQARTGIVEAIVANQDARLKPGQFVQMRISLGQPRRTLAIPISAIQAEPALADAGKDLATVFVAEPDASGSYLVHRRQVRLGPTSRGFAPVLEGLEAGEFVVSRPAKGLREGARVRTVESDESSQRQIRITEQGYEPKQIVLPANEPATIEFLRTVDPTCADVLIIKKLGIRKDLPLNKPVKIEVPASPPGELEFHCGMDMFRGKVLFK